MQNEFKKTGLLVFGVLSFTPSSMLYAQDLEHQDERVEEIIVTSALHRSRDETVLPINVLAGEELREKAAATLGDMLQAQVGVNNASFGVGVGHPVIRGQSANRVQVLQGGVGNLDASAVSADHANSLEPALAERIEVVRGPATLLYGNGAIGGVVNVIDNSIPTSVPDGLTALLESRHNSVADQQTTVAKLEGGSGQFAWHIDAIDRHSNDTEVSGFAINPGTVDINDAEAFEELLESRGRLNNSNGNADSQTLGASWIHDKGYFGIAYNQLENNYGLPRGSHTQHAHVDVTQLDDHDMVHDEAEGDMRIVLEQQRWSLEAHQELDGIFTESHGRISVVDYQHAEVEADGSIGTEYNNEGVEGRFLLHLQPVDAREGVVGIQFGSRTFSALGEEAFIPKTDIGSLAVFTVQSLDLGNFTHEGGLRVERQAQDQSGNCDHSSTDYSGGLASLWRYRSDTNLLLSVNHSKRSASVEERYSNIDTGCNELDSDHLIAHAATRRLEIGLPDASRESATNLEMGVRKHSGTLTGELNVFYNDIADYLYLHDTGLFERDVEIARYQQQDAVFTGLEAELSTPLFSNGDHLSQLTVFGDLVRARFDHGGNVPRIPAARIGMEWTHSHLHWLVKLRWTHVAAQTDYAFNESRSNSYQLLSVYADYHIDFAERSSLLLFLRGNNLLDESIRNHVSLQKDIAPEPGRGIEIGIRFEY